MDEIDPVDARDGVDNRNVDSVYSEQAADALEQLELEKTERRQLRKQLHRNKRVAYVLCGRLMDYESDTSDRKEREDSRTRKMATHGRHLLTLCTTRGLLIVVQRDTPAETDYRSIPYGDIVDVSIQRVGQNQRLVVRASNRYYIDVSGSDPALVETVRSDIEQRIERDAVETHSPDPIETIERLGALHEQGILTQAEFDEKKRELLDQI
jgi:hypothetical protein